MYRSPSKISWPLLLLGLFVTCGKHSAQSDIRWQMMSLTENTLGFLTDNDYVFCGIATPETIPECTDGKVYYLAAMPGDYYHFGEIKLGNKEKAVIYKQINNQDEVKYKQEHNTFFERNTKKEQTIELSTCNLKNCVLTNENRWNEQYSGITVLTDYIPVIKGIEYVPISLGDNRITVYHYDTNKQFIDITSWYTLNGPFVTLGDFVRIGVRKIPVSRISPYDIKKQGVKFYAYKDKLARININDRRLSDSLQLVFEDNFDIFDSLSWEKHDSSDPSFILNFGAAPFKRNNVSIVNGKLVLEAKNETILIDGKQFSYTSGLVEAKDKFVINSGKVEVRMKVDFCPDSNVALWLNPQFGRWPEGQEIDIVEITKKDYAAGALHYTSHTSYQNAGTAVHDDVIIRPVSGMVNLSDWHIWSCEWDGKTIKYYCDNVLYGIIKSSETMPDIPYNKSAKYLVFSYGLAETNKKRNASYKMMIDWARVYTDEVQNKQNRLWKNEIVLDYDMNKALTMHVNEWRGIYPRLRLFDGDALSKLKLKIIKDDNHILSMGNTNMVLYSHREGTAICELSTNNMTKRFKVVVEANER